MSATIFVRLREQLLESFEVEAAVVVDLEPLQHSAFALAQKMPGNDVGVVLHHRQNNLVAFADMRLAEGSRDQIHGLGRAAGENDLVRRFGVEEAAQRLARALIAFGCGIGEIMQSAMHIGVFMLVEMRQPIDHGARLLRRGGVVEIGKRLPVGTLGKNRKIRPNRFDVISRLNAGNLVHRLILLESHALTRSLRNALNCSSSIASIASLAKPSMSKASASRRGSPRAVR